MQRTRSRRWAIGTLAGTAALAAGTLSGVAPAQAATTHTVTISLTPAVVGYSISYSCGSTYSDVGSTDQSGRATFTNVPNGVGCGYTGAPNNIFIDPQLAAASSPYGSIPNTAVPASAVDQALTAAVPANTGFRCAAPSSVSGTPAVGQTVTAVLPAFVNGTVDPTKTKYFWLRLTVRNGHLVSQVAQGVTATDPVHHVVSEADLGWQLLVIPVVTSTAATSTVCDWNPTAVVGRLGTPSPGRPAIRGRATVGKPLVAVSRAVPAGTTATYQWFRSVVGKGHKVRLVKIRGAHLQRYRVHAADRGRRLYVAVTYSRSPFDPTTVLSPGKRVR